jgi:AraC-like DNA-binding protein
MKKLEPLKRFRVADTNRVEEAEAKISRSLTAVRIMKLTDRNRFQLRINNVNIGNTSLVYARFGTDTKLTSIDEDHVHFIIGSSMPSTFNLYDRSVVVTTQNASMIVSPKQFSVERPEGSETLVLRTSLSDLQHHFEELTTQHHRGPLTFDHVIDLANGPGAILNRMINYLVYELEHNDQALKNPGLSKSYNHMLLTALLSLPHNQSEKLFKSYHNQVAPGLVRRAEEYMRAHLNEAVTIISLLRICDCSRSVLFSAFKNARGYTPMEFLTEQRLLGAREKLLKQHPEDSVSSIALDYGFIHLGRFSKVYKKRFGVTPSITLKKRK